MRQLFVSIFILILAGCAHHRAPLTADQVYHHALRGNVDKALQALQAVDEVKSDPKLIEVKNKFTQRFVTKKEVYKSSGDKHVDELLNIYRKYWDAVLLKNKTVADGEKSLLDELNLFLQQKTKLSTPTANMEAAMPKVQAWLGKNNYYSIMGKTLPFYELMIWKKEWEKVYDVPLFDKKQKVKIVFMDQFVSLGWAAYATFDKLYTGGWAGSDKLYCVRPVYDLESEKFKIIYLAHEARHFSDYKDYPKLQQAELEYRAKLEELTTLDQNMFPILQRFIDGGRDDRATPHAFAEFKVIAHLGRKLNVSARQLLNKEKGTIHEAAKDLLEESNAFLNKQPLTEKYL